MGESQRGRVRGDWDWLGGPAEMVAVLEPGRARWLGWKLPCSVSTRLSHVLEHLLSPRGYFTCFLVSLLSSQRSLSLRKGLGKPPQHRHLDDVAGHSVFVKRTRRWGDDCKFINGSRCAAAIDGRLLSTQQGKGSERGAREGGVV